MGCFFGRNWVGDRGLGDFSEITGFYGSDPVRGRSSGSAVIVLPASGKWSVIGADRVKNRWDGRVGRWKREKWRIDSKSGFNVPKHINLFILSRFI